MQSETQAPNQRLKWLLIGSLVVNMVLIGLIAGSGLKARNGPQRMDIGIGPITQFLSPEDRKAIGQSLRGRNDGRRSGRRDTRAFTTALTGALRADTFDRSAVETAIAAQRDRGTEASKIVASAFLDRLAVMSLADRAAMADRIEAQRKP